MAELHYATISDIRSKAGFSQATNLSDFVVSDQRRSAEAELNSTLGKSYVVPFTPVPEIIRTLTIDLAAAMLVFNAYRDDKSQRALDAVRERILGYAEGSAVIPGADGVDLSTAEGVTGYFGESDFMFKTEQVF